MMADLNLDSLDLAQLITRLVQDVDAIVAGKSGPQIFERFSEAMKRHGFDKIMMGQGLHTDNPELTSRSFLYQTGVDDFLRVYLQKDYLFSDPIILRALGTHRPFRWREAYADMTPTQTKQIEEARSHGLKYGYLFPIIDKPGPTGFVSMGRSTDFELSRLAFLEIEILVRYAYLAIDRTHDQGSDSKIQISPREVAVLLQVAMGKTNWEIGQILGISEYSVRDYLKSLAKRLETSNRTHTVVRAIQLGLILP